MVEILYNTLVVLGVIVLVGIGAAVVTLIERRQSDRATGQRAAGSTTEETKKTAQQ